MSASDNARSGGTGQADHDACIADQALGARRGYIDTEVGEEFSFNWGLAELDENDLFHLRTAVQRYFRHVAAKAVGDADDIRLHVATVQRVGELVAAIEVVEKARGVAASKQIKWRDAKQAADYRREQEAMREKARVAVRPPSVADTT